MGMIAHTTKKSHIAGSCPGSKSSPVLVRLLVRNMVLEIKDNRSRLSEPDYGRKQSAAIL